MPLRILRVASPWGRETRAVPSSLGRQTIDEKHANAPASRDTIAEQ